MTVISIANASGSAGKTTLGVTLAALIAQSGITCDLVDFDPQGNATHWAGVDVTAGQPTIADVLEAEIGTVNLTAARHTTAIPGLRVVPVNRDRMEGIELRLSRLTGAEQLLRIALESDDDPAQVTIIDCPGSLGLLTVSALVASEKMLTVTAPGMKELGGLPLIAKTLDKVRKVYRPGLTLAGVVPSIIPPRSAGRHYTDALEQLQGQWTDKVAPAVRRAVRVPESYAAREPLPLYDPTAPVTDDYRQVLTWLTAQGALA
ncbi:chromosome partitioning protein [Nakamurella sp. UYEF19]|uniref:ParA family protein n=1 Tax=Nakamurella sp. UYEF19 TaxID=1756392 RepID=UPI0033957DA7